jgi:hypothetical protein
MSLEFEFAVRLRNGLCVCSSPRITYNTMGDGTCSICEKPYIEGIKEMNKTEPCVNDPNGHEYANKVKRLKEKQPEFAAVKDSGERRETITGAVRDRQKGKGRYDLLSTVGIRRLALHYEYGSFKYSARNWEKGMPLSWFIDSALRHLFSYLDGDRSEDHMAAAAWNACGFMHIEQRIREGKLPKELDDMGVTDRPLFDDTTN